VCVCSACPRSMQHIHTHNRHYDAYATHTAVRGARCEVRGAKCEVRGVRISDPWRSRCRILSYSREYEQCVCMMHICVYGRWLLRLQRHLRRRLRACVCAYMCVCIHEPAHACARACCLRPSARPCDTACISRKNIGMRERMYTRVEWMDARIPMPVYMPVYMHVHTAHRVMRNACCM
jgi:hypothetical protein